MNKHLIQGALAFTASALSLNASANGIAINEQSASGAGTAYAGRASSALDVSTLYGNPAGLSKLKGTQISAGLAVVDAKDDISGAQSAAAGTSKGDSVPLAAVPFAYLATPIDDRFSFGLGMYVPYGIINDYESRFQGRYHGSYSKVQVITVQPTLSYKINDRFAIGFGPTFNRIEGTLKNDLATAALNPGKGDARLKIEGDDTAVGYNIGLLVDLDDATRFGMTYHSKVDYHLKGHTQVENSPSFLGLNGKYDTSLDVTLPESLDISFTHHFDERWTGYLGTTWTRWSRLDQIEAVNKGVPALGQRLGFEHIAEPMNWHDTWALAVGGSYQLDNQWILRAGFAYDPSPTTNADRTVRIPVGDRKTVTLGFGYSPSETLTLDVAYAYLWENTASLHQANESGLQPAYSAKYDNSAHGLTAQLTYHF
ncbi:outer membrane protein transport protein [Pseudomonas sp. NY15437]|uniref:outer membrane protein transport protein n=1 Tax=Pseudomonas sp. NY15437 TaxID=3400360 RepID=UPI003A86064D